LLKIVLNGSPTKGLSFVNMKKINLTTIYVLIMPFLAFAQWHPSSYYTKSPINACSFLNKDSFLISLNGRIFQTKNGGADFDSFPNYPPQLALNLVYKSADTLFVARETTKGLLYSYDAGNTWKTQTLIMQNGDTAFKNGKIGFFGFFDENNGIIFGDTLKGVQQVFLTQNGGLNWTFYAPLTPHIVDFPTSSRYSTSINNYLYPTGFGKLIIAGSKLLTFKNFGREWYVDSILPSDKSYVSIAFKDELNGIARISVPTKGLIPFKTSDGGNSWLDLTDSTRKSNGNLSYVKPTSKLLGFYLASTPSSSGESNVSYNEGVTWQLFDTLNHGSGSVFFRDAETGVCSENSITGSPVYYYRPINTGTKHENKNARNKLILYPNPANTVLYFNQSYQFIQLWDIQGKMVASYDQTNSVDISPIPTGLYWVKAIDGQGIFATQKLLIQH
jgi:photosystem II stability/assembly factor-like uncharacterized protein